MVTATRLVPVELEMAERLESIVDALRAEVGYLLSKRGIDPEQWTVLKHLSRAEVRGEPSDIEAIFRRTGMPLDLVLDILAQCRVRGLVRDAGGGAWALTPEGHVLVDPIEHLESDTAVRMMRGLPAGEMSRLERVLDRLAFNLRQA